MCKYLMGIKNKKHLLESLKPFLLKEEKLIEEHLRIKETCYSNRIEGSTYTEGETRLLITEKITQPNKSVEDTLSILNMNRVLWKIRNEKYDWSIDKDSIICIHNELMRGIDDIEPGVRTCRNWIGGASIHTSPPNAIHKHLDELIDWYNTNKDTLNPVILAIKFKYRFVCIHPFEDGNGRTSRILMNLILQNNNYLPIIIEDKASYYNALELSNRESDNMKCTALCDFLCKCLLDEYDDIINRMSFDE